MNKNIIRRDRILVLIRGGGPFSDNKGGGCILVLIRGGGHFSSNKRGGGHFSANKRGGPLLTT